jgi:hypothetical protein
MTVPAETTVAQDTRELHAKSEVPASYWEILARVGFPMQELRRLGQVRTGRSALDLTGTLKMAAIASYSRYPMAVRTWPGRGSFGISGTTNWM